MTPASPPAVAAGAAQRVLQNPHGAHAPGAPPALPGRSRRASGGEEGGVEVTGEPRSGGTVRRPAEPGRKRASWVGGVGTRGGARPVATPILQVHPSPWSPPARSAAATGEQRLEGAAWEGAGPGVKTDRAHGQSSRKKNLGRRGESGPCAHGLRGASLRWWGEKPLSAPSELGEKRQGWERWDSLVPLKMLLERER